MYEAVDLAEAHPADAAEEARSMESLLHWAIGERPAMHLPPYHA